MDKWKKNAVSFIGSQMISLFGSAVVQYAITWYITLETNSGSAMTIAILCGFLPTLALSPFAGVWADRYDKKKLIALADSVIAVTTLLLAVGFFMGYRELWLLYVALGIRGLGTAIQMPCTGAILPDFVPSEQLTRINGLNSSLQAIISLAAPVVSGAILSVARIEIIFFIDVVTAIIGVSVLMFFLKLPKQQSLQMQSSESYFFELKKGMQFICSQRYLVVLFLYMAVVYLAVGPVQYLTPLQVVRVFGEEVWRMSAASAGLAGGMIFGGILMMLWKGFRNKTTTLFFSMTMIGLCVALLGAAVPFWLYLCMAGCIGLFLSIFNTNAVAMLQIKIEPDYLGRVFSILTMLSSSLTPMGMLFFGPLADRVSIGGLLVGTGIVMALVGVAIIITPSLRKTGNEVAYIERKCTRNNR